MPIKERYDTVVYSSTIGSWLVQAWDSEEQIPLEMTVEYSDIVSYCADTYYEGNKNAAQKYVDSIDIYDFEQEVKNYFIHKMS